MGHLKKVIVESSYDTKTLDSSAQKNNKCTNHNFQIISFDGIYAKVKCKKCGEIFTIRY